MLVCVWKPSNPDLVSFRWPDGRMPRSREPGVSLLLQGELPRGTEQPQTPARPGHEAQGQRGNRQLTDPCVCGAISSPLAEIKCAGWLYQRLWRDKCLSQSCRADSPLSVTFVDAQHLCSVSFQLAVCLFWCTVEKTPRNILLGLTSRKHVWVILLKSKEKWNNN